MDKAVRRVDHNASFIHAESGRVRGIKGACKEHEKGRFTRSGNPFEEIKLVALARKESGLRRASVNALMRFFALLL